jgi:Domain of unknown function (DUF4114)/PEP-CTERM motif
MQRCIGKPTNLADALQRTPDRRIKMIRTTLATLGMGVALAAGGPAAADPIDPVNTRPVTLNVIPSEPSLQSFLDGLFGPGWGNAATDQTPFGMFRAATSSGTAIPTVVAEFAGLRNVNKFGIWFGTDSSNVFAYELLKGAANVGDFAAISINEGSLDVIGFGCGVRVNCGENVTNSAITASRFGFYFQTNTGPNYYSVDALNPGNSARVLGLQQGVTTNWAFAYEDGTDGDYNDMIVKVESIVPVPEPGVYLMLLAGLGVLGAISMRKRG